MSSADHDTMLQDIFLFRSEADNADRKSTAWIGAMKQMPIATLNFRRATLLQSSQILCPPISGSDIKSSCIARAGLSNVHIGGFNQRQGEALPPQIYLTLSRSVFTVQTRKIWSVYSQENHRNCCHLMSDFKAKRHQIRFPLGLSPRPR